MKEGQVVFWNLKFLMGTVKVAVGQKIMKVDDDKKLFKICYLTEGKTQGSQYVQLFPTEDGKTRVVHFTRYNSASNLRNKLYPGLHDKAITEFHQSVMDIVAERKKVAQL